jgi:MbtH protein
MPSDDSEDDKKYTVVVNDEGQYSIWPEGKGVPNGWRQVGTSGAKAECLEYIGQVWTDMRPLSLRRKAQEAEDGITH